MVSDKTAITGNLAIPRCTLLLLLSAPLPAPSPSLKILQVPHRPSADLSFDLMHQYLWKNPAFNYITEKRSGCLPFGSKAILSRKAPLLPVVKQTIPRVKNGAQGIVVVVMIKELPKDETIGPHHEPESVNTFTHVQV
uniref:Uncharacterized protein n=1 Tax=Moniliophthora roreri TaxID=221103 RepID=A0A0W0FLS5_MONRR